jgi:hypothetical protein
MRLRIHVRRDADGWLAVRDIDRCKVLFRCRFPEDDPDRPIIELARHGRKVLLDLMELPALAAAETVVQD